ncbi:MAG: extracellular solute-binding protein [Bacillota bacterium]
MKKLFLQVFGVMMAVVLILTGCASNTSQNDTATSQSDTSTSQNDTSGDTQTSSASQEKNARQSFKGTKLNILLKTGYETEAITKFADEFESETGISLNVEVYDEPTLRNKFILDCNSKTGNYDVVATQFWYMPEYNQTGWLEPLDDYIANKSDEEWNNVSEMPNSVLDMFRGPDGKLYSICVSSTGGVLIYRKDLFSKHGIEEPKTTSDVLAAAKILKEKEPEIYPFVGRGDSSSASFGTSAGWAWAYGARVMDEQGNVTINTPEMKEAMTDFVELMRNYAPADAAAMGWDTMSEIYRQGKAAMNFDMSGFVSAYSNKEASSVVGLIDCNVITGLSGNCAQWMYGEGLGISSFSKNKDAAWLMLQWRNSLEVLQKEVANDIRFDVTDPRVYETNTFKEKTKDIGFFTDKLPAIMESIDAKYWPATPLFDKVAEAFQQKISLAIAGDITVEEALAQAQTDVEAVLK